MVTTDEANAMLAHSLALVGQIGSASISRGAGMDRNKSEEKRNTEDNDAKLKQLLTGKKAEQDAISGNAAAAEAWAKSQGLKPGTYSMHPSESGYAIDPRDPKPPGYMLTPGARAAEEAGAKKLADYEVGGGRATAAKNIEQVGTVEDDLKNGKRDSYDRKVGGFLNNAIPSLMGTFAPAEKARRDKAYNAAVNLAKQSDPNPTETQIKNIMGQIYDPSSDDSSNLERIQRFQQQQRGVDADMSRASENLRTTGYVMPGLSGNDRAPPQPHVQQAPARGHDKLHSFLKGSPAQPGRQVQAQQPQGQTGLEHMSDEDLQAMARKLGL